MFSRSKDSNPAAVNIPPSTFRILRLSKRATQNLSPRDPGNINIMCVLLRFKHLQALESDRGRRPESVPEGEPEQRRKKWKRDRKEKEYGRKSSAKKHWIVKKTVKKILGLRKMGMRSKDRIQL